MLSPESYLGFFRNFAPLSEDSFNVFLSKCKKKIAAKNEIILGEGDVQRDMLLVLKGLQMSYCYHNDRQHIIAFSYPPSLSGVPESFIERTASRFCLQAISDSEFLSISYDDFDMHIRDFPDFERLYRKMTEAVLCGTIQRCIELQAFSIEERFSAFAKRSPHLLQLIPHKYLASYLNISASNFSRLYNSVKIR
jgi:CRP-like cAMP-binding protein